MNLNYYKTHTLLKAIEALPPVRTFLKDTFFPDGETFVTEEVLIDVKKGKRKMAPFVAPRVGGITVDREGFKTEKYAAPKIAPQRILTVDDLMIRGLGENVFSNRTPEQRQAEVLVKDLQDLQDMNARRLEWLASQIIFGGKAILKGYIDRTNTKFVEQELDYDFTNKVMLTGTDAVTGQWGKGGNIYGQLEAWQKQVTQATGKKPTIGILGSDAAIALRDDKNLREMMNLLNMNFGQITPQVQDDAVTFIGRLTGLGLDLYTYDDWYLDDNDDLKPYVPANQVALLNKDMGSFLYGAITQMENNTFKTYEGRNIPKSWSDNANEQRLIRLSSRPVPVPNDVDSWLVAEVL